MIKTCLNLIGHDNQVMSLIASNYSLMLSDSVLYISFEVQLGIKGHSMSSGIRLVMTHLRF